MVVVDVVVDVPVAVADEDHSGHGHGHDQDQDHDLPRLSRDYGEWREVACRDWLGLRCPCAEMLQKLQSADSRLPSPQSP